MAQERACQFIEFRSSGFRESAVDSLSPVLSPSDVVDSEGIGYVGYFLIDTYIHDPFGLVDPYLARNGEPVPKFGKMDVYYTVFEKRPSVMIWHYAGHLKGIDPQILDREYQTFCYSDCSDWNADIVMIRIDRGQELSLNFSD